MYLIGNGKVVTRDPENPYLPQGAVAFDQGGILAVGQEKQLETQYPQAQRLDAKGGLIMPAYINPHEHIYSAFARGLSIPGYAPKNFLELLEGLWWNIDSKLTLAQTRLSAMATFLDCIKNGVTTVFDHHASYSAIGDSLFQISDAASALGVRACLCYEISDRAGAEKTKEALEENLHFYRHSKNNPMQAAMMGMHASFTLSDETMALCQSEKPAEMGYHIHVAEGIEDLQHCLKHYHKSVVHRLYDWGILGEKTLAAHCVYVSPREMDLLRDSNTTVLHNPQSNMGNACGCPPTLALYEKGILCGLGTDGYSHDVLDSYKTANILHKHQLGDSTVAWNEIPDMLFSGNAQIANRFFQEKSGKALGILKPGASADIIVADYNPLTPLHAHNINSHILFGVTGRHTVTTICQGKILMQDRQLTFIDEEKVMADCRQAAAQLASQIQS